VIVARTLTAVGPPLIVKLAEDAPAGTVTAEGTLAAALLLLRETVAPVDGAGLPRVIVPWVVAPARIDDGAMTNDDSGGWMVRVELTLAPE
jgi:hypothetical protein